MPWWGKLIYFIGALITLFPILTGLYRIKHLDRKTLSVFIWMCSMLLIELYSSHQSSLSINNSPSGHLMIFLNALFGCYFFYFAVDSAVLKKVILGSELCLLLYLMINPFLILSPSSIRAMNGPHGIPMTIQAYALMVWSFIYFVDLLQKEQVLELSQSPEFIIAIAILFYFGTTQFVQLFQEYVMRHIREMRFVFRYVDISIMIVYYFLIGIGLWNRKL
tara:strand:- start:498 stop:1157 length:660 start_codon:yes stop_codon:yes gene_type:complete